MVGTEPLLFMVIFTAPPRHRILFFFSAKLVNRSVFSLLWWLETWHCSHLLACCWPPCCCKYGSKGSRTSYWCIVQCAAHTHTHTRPFNGPFSGSTQVSRYQKGKTNLDFTEARAREWQWHQLGHMQVCILLQTDNHTSTPPPTSCRPTNSVKALKAVCSNRLILPACRAHGSKPAGCMPEI